MMWEMDGGGGGGGGSGGGYALSFCARREDFIQFVYTETRGGRNSTQYFFLI